MRPVRPGDDPQQHGRLACARPAALVALVATQPTVRVQLAAGACSASRNPSRSHRRSPATAAARMFIVHRARAEEPPGAPDPEPIVIIRRRHRKFYHMIIYRACYSRIQLVAHGDVRHLGPSGSVARDERMRASTGTQSSRLVRSDKSAPHPRLRAQLDRHERHVLDLDAPCSAGVTSQ